MRSIRLHTLGQKDIWILPTNSWLLTNIYPSFGVAAVLLELVPVASILFAFTNTVGAALWAADMEKGKVTSQGTAPSLREQAKRAE